LLGNAKRYVREIYRGFDDAGYYCRHWLLDASKMGVPQRRERVFFVALRKDLAKPFLRQMNLFDVLPELKLEFSEPEIPFSEIEDAEDLSTKENTIVSKYWDMVGEGQSFSVAHPKGSFFNDHRCRRNAPLKTITASTSHGAWHYSIKRRINSKETVLGGSFPADYDFGGVAPKYLVGMSVPPVMMANIAIEIFDQWLYRPACR
jgi:DNA (cytosine-5)-methyltransferase 1